MDKEEEWRHSEQSSTHDLMAAADQAAKQARGEAQVGGPISFVRLRRGEMASPARWRIR